MSDEQSQPFEKTSDTNSSQDEEPESHKIAKETISEILANLNLQNRPKTYQEQILEYLKQQELYGEDEQTYSLRHLSQEASDYAKTILLRLLEDVNNIIGFKEALDLEKKRKNQSDLFDLSEKITGFHINDQVMEKLAFRETLIIGRINENGQAEPVGGLCLDIQSALGSLSGKQATEKFPDFASALYAACSDLETKYNEDDAPEQIRKDLEEYREYLEEEMKTEYRKFLIHLSSQLNVDGKNAGSRITAWVDRNLHTIEEKRSEHIENDPTKNKSCPLPFINKKSYVFMAKKHYDVRVDPGCDYNNKYCYSFCRAKDLIGEAANFVLMRYLACTRFIGKFEMSALHISGKLTRNIYECEGPIGGYINNERMDLCKIYRTIVEECGIVQRSCTVLALDGRIMKQDWDNCDYVLLINPLLSPTKKKPTLILHFNEAWKYDLQLLSHYLDRKLCAGLHMKSYLQDHQEIGNMINDFVQNVVQIKPDNIIEFAKQYFLSYAPFLLPRTEYFEKDVNRSFDREE